MVTIGTGWLVSSSTVGKNRCHVASDHMSSSRSLRDSVVNIPDPFGHDAWRAISAGNALLNLLPVTIGNLVGGTVFDGMALYATYSTEAALSPSQHKYYLLSRTNNKLHSRPAAALGRLARLRVILDSLLL